MESAFKDWDYNVNPACPPESGTAEEMKQRALQYEKTLVLQTMQEDMHDSAQYKKDKLLQNKMTEELAEKMKAEGKTDILIMSAGPYKHNSCKRSFSCEFNVYIHKKSSIIESINMIVQISINGEFMGSMSAIVLPFLLLARTFTWPPCCLAISATRARPRPAPPMARLRDLSTRKNGSKIFS